MTINCRGNLLDLSLPKVMGILNCTVDSFYDGGNFVKNHSIAQKIDDLVQEGADIIDVGGQSTRPGAKLLSAEEEWQNVQFALEYLQQNYPEQLVSLDSFWSENHVKADKFGVAIINDISAGGQDKNMFSTVVQLQKPYILMHMKSIPENMQLHANYDNIVLDINYFFSEKIAELNTLGVNDIILDVGFGFAKTTEQNFDLLKHLDLIDFGALPQLVGISRKSMVYKSLDISAEEALNGTTALHMYALQKGANILRVHDVKAAKECIRLFNLLEN